MQIIAPPGRPTYCAGISCCLLFAMASPATATDLVIDLPWGRIAARRWGQAGARPLLACHGWLDNAASFDRLAPLLADGHALDIVAIDLPGHGHSSWLPQGYSQPTQAACVLAVLDALGWRQATLMGHSMGAGIACLLAASVPERVQALICLDALGQLSAAADTTVERLRKHLLTCVPGQPRAHRPMADLAEAIARRQRHSPLALADTTALVERGTVHDGHRWQWRHDPALAAPSAVYLHEEQVLALLAAITCPTLLLQAEPASRHLPAGMQQQRRTAVPALQTITLPGGHHLHMGNAAGAARAIQAFLNAGGLET